MLVQFELAQRVLFAAGENLTAQVLSIAPFLMIGVLFYMMLIRPERRKRAELDVMLKNLKKNDRVVTVGGILGTVVNAPKDAEDITLKVDEGSNTRLHVLRSSITRVIGPTVSESNEST